MPFLNVARNIRCVTPYFRDCCTQRLRNKIRMMIEHFSKRPLVTCYGLFAGGGEILR